MQSIAALENTSGLSVLTKTSNTSSKMLIWLVSLSSPLLFTNDSVRTTRRAPNKGRQPDLISVLWHSTNSQMDATIYARKNSEYRTAWNSFSIRTWSWTSESQSSKQSKFSNGLKSASLKWKWGSSDWSLRKVVTISCMLVMAFLEILLSLWQAA